MSSTVEIGFLNRSFWRLSGCSLSINLFAVDCIYGVILEITNNASAEPTQ